VCSQKFSQKFSSKKVFKFKFDQIFADLSEFFQLGPLPPSTPMLLIIGLLLEYIKILFFLRYLVVLTVFALIPMIGENI